MDLGRFAGILGRGDHGYLDWRLLTVAELRDAWETLEHHVHELTEAGVLIPDCWYLHSDWSTYLRCHMLWAMTLQTEWVDFEPRDALDYWTTVYREFPAIFEAGLARCKRRHEGDQPSIPTFTEFVASRCDEHAQLAAEGVTT